MRIKFAVALFVFLHLVIHPSFIWTDNPPAAIDFSAAARLAIAASDELRSESRSLELMEGAWSWGLRAYLPRLSLNASEDDRISEISTDSFLKNYTINIDQLVWDGGRISASRKLERADLNIAAQNLERMTREIAEAAVSVYRDVVYYRMVLEIRENAFKYLEEQRRILLLELDLGMVLPIDLAAADITIAEANIELRTIKIDLVEAEQRLAETLGLDTLPLLSENVDIYRSTCLPDPAKARAAAETGNPGLIAAKNMINRRLIEAKYASLSWIPTVRLLGSFGLSGRQYPLTKYNWSIGITIDFSSPWFAGNLSGSAGREGVYDRNARMQSAMSPLPDPASSFSARAAALNLDQEEINYANAFRLTGRMAEQALDKCLLLDQKRELAVEAMELEAERYRLAELRLELGRLTRVDLMNAMLSCAEREIGAVRAAVSLLEAERELERFLDLAPGELAVFAGQGQ